MARRKFDNLNSIYFSGQDVPDPVLNSATTDTEDISCSIQKTSDMQVREIDIDLLIPYHRESIESDESDSKKHLVFRDYSKDRLNELADKIRANGLYEPINCFESRQQKGKYEILAGKHRTAAYALNRERFPEEEKWKTISAIVYPYEKAAGENGLFSFADSVYINTNIWRRKGFARSERGAAYEMAFQAYEHAGSKGHGDSNALVAKDFGEPVTVREVREFRHLIPKYYVEDFLQMIDEGYVAESIATTRLYAINKENQKIMTAWAKKQSTDKKPMAYLGKLLKAGKIKILVDMLAMRGTPALLTEEDLNSALLRDKIDVGYKGITPTKIRQILPDEYKIRSTEDIISYLQRAVDEYERAHADKT